MIEYTEAISAEITFIHKRELESDGYEVMLMADPTTTVKKVLDADNVVITAHKVFKRDEFRKDKVFRAPAKDLHSRYDAAIEHFETVIEEMRAMQREEGIDLPQDFYNEVRKHYIVAVAAMKACRDIAHGGNS